MASETAPQAGAPQPAAPSQAPQQQMTAEAPARPRTPGYAPAFGGASGAAWVFRDLASI